MLNKIKRQLLSFEASILKYIYSGGGYWLINLDFSSTHLVLLLVSRCCFSSVVSCQSHRKKFFFWTESWIWDFYRSQYRPSLKTVDSVALLLSCASWCPRENRIFIFSSAYSLFILFFVCVLRCFELHLVWVQRSVVLFRKHNIVFPEKFLLLFFTLLTFTL